MSMMGFNWKSEYDNIIILFGKSDRHKEWSVVGFEPALTAVLRKYRKDTQTELQGPKDKEPNIWMVYIMCLFCGYS